jgi:hypothetical protein
MVVVDGRGVPVGAQLASAQISEHRLAESTLEQVKVPRRGRGRPGSRRLIVRVLEKSLQSRPFITVAHGFNQLPKRNRLCEAAIG